MQFTLNSLKVIFVSNKTKIIILYYVVSRTIFILAGFRIHIDYSFMHFHDMDLLENNFWETVLHTHSFTPWINMLAGFVLKFPDFLHTAIYQLVFYAMSLGSLLIFSSLLGRLKIPKKLNVTLVVLFGVTPAYIYFEHFLGYTFPSMFLLLLIAYYFCKSFSEKTFASWLGFFSVCALLCFVRTTFHIIWFLALIPGIMLITRKYDRTIILAYVAPALILFLWYAKNLVIFGFFGASSWSGFNLAFSTINRLDMKEKTQLVQDGYFSELALIPLYSGIEVYADSSESSNKTGIEVLDSPNKQVYVGAKKTQSINYNNIGYIHISKLRMKDNLAYIRKFPIAYGSTVIHGIAQFYGPSTRWHPRDKDHSPHAEMRKNLGWWENMYNGFFHSLPVKIVGLYIFFMIILMLNFTKYFICLLKNENFGFHDKLVSFITMNVVYVTLLSCMVTYGELARYRFMIEPFIWLLMANFLYSFYSRTKIIGSDVGPK